jgi:hypothetical protein
MTQRRRCAVQRQYVIGGIAAGLVGGLAMSVYTMAAELVAGHSMFTPMYMVGAPVVGMGAMERGMSGGPLYLELVPAIVGMVVHFIWAALWGLVFGGILWASRLSGWVAFATAIVYAYAVGAIMSAVVMPAVGLKPMWEMPGLVFFVLDHLAFGLPLGIWALAFLPHARVRPSGQVRGSTA